MRLGTPVQPVVVDVTGGKLLELITEEASDGLYGDYTFWGEARLIKGRQDCRGERPHDDKNGSRECRHAVPSTEGAKDCPDGHIVYHGGRRAPPRQ